MTVQHVKESSAFDMIGPYLAAKAVCPGCQRENVLLYSESYGSPVKTLKVCEHIKAHIVDEEGLGVFEFDY